MGDGVSSNNLYTPVSYVNIPKTGGNVNRF